MVNPGEGWQDLRHPGRSALLEYRLRVHCHEHYYGPSCNLLCRPRDDFFGHHSCDAAGNKVCLDGWTGNKCQRGMSGAGGLARGRARKKGLERSRLPHCPAAPPTAGLSCPNSPPLGGALGGGGEFKKVKMDAS